MMKTHVLLYVALFFSFELPAQTKNNELKAADELFENKRFAEAVQYYLILLKKDSLNADLNYKIGVCYLNSRSQKNKAIAFLEKAVTSGNLSTLPTTIYKTLGDSYYMNQQPSKAITAYEKYKASLSPRNLTDPSEKDLANWKIEMSKLTKKIAEENKPYSHTSFFSADERQLTITIYNETSTKERAFFQDFYKSSGKEIPKISVETAAIKVIPNEATIGTSLDAKSILLYRNDNGSCNIYTSFLDSNKWSRPLRLDRKINDRGWEDGEYISADGQTLYFTSDREGGFGGRDIYKSERLSTGEWGKAINLGPTINSPYDDEAPFIHPDHRTLYFSTNRYTRTNSLDILRTHYSDDTGWAFPVNIGYPLKIITSESSVSELTLHRNTKSKGLITFADERQSHLTLLIGFAAGPTEVESPKEIKITVSNNENGHQTGSYLSKGDFLFLLPENTASNITYEAPGYLFFIEQIALTKNSASIATKRVRYFTPISAGSKVLLNNIFFEQNLPELLQSSSMELNKLADLLMENKNMTVELSGYVSSGPNKKYNIRLSQERVDAIIQYLIMKGINKERLIAKDYGRLSVQPKDRDDEKSIISSSDQKIELKISSISSKKNNSITNNK
ncbi:MAG TPA: OmpA family protein [Bacteroidia bacterium]|jgi:outer membrane protein OmpA-like peptidoglycan-associated protein/tetratricopeptide (TPR) repeat protein